MTMKGYNLTGLGDFAGLMSKGYQDYLDLYNKDRALTVQEKQADYMYPAETVVPAIAAKAISQDPMQLLAQAYQAGRTNVAPPQFIIPPTMNRASGQQMSPAQIIQAQPGRAPQGESDAPDFSQPPAVYNGTEPLAPQAAPVGDTEELQTLASQLGLQVKNGQLVAKGKQGEKILDLYEKLIGSAASVYGNAARGSGEYKTISPVMVGSVARGGGRAKLTPYEEKRVKDIDEEVKDLRDLKKDAIRQYQELRGVMVPDGAGGQRRLRQNELNSYIDQQIQLRKVEQENIFGGSSVGANAPGATKPSQAQGAMQTGANVPAFTAPSGAKTKRWDKVKKTTTYVFPDGREETVDGIR